jgi:hypothetical protein
VDDVQTWVKPSSRQLSSHSRLPYAHKFPSVVIPAKAGIQTRTLRRNAPLFFDWQPFWLDGTYWIPAFAGMTVVFLPSRE